MEIIVEKIVGAGEDGVYNILVPIMMAILTWFLSRMKTPDHGKKDWKCKKNTSSFEHYTIYLVIIFMMPVIAYILIIFFLKVYINPLLGETIEGKTIEFIGQALMVIIYIAIYVFITWEMRTLKVLFVPKKLEKSSNRWVRFLLYCPIIYIFAISIGGICKGRLDLPSGYMVLICVFQIVSLGILEDDRRYKYKKVTIVMNNCEKIDADVNKIYKKGKWLRINIGIPRKEMLVVFDDIKSIEYHD